MNFDFIRTIVEVILGTGAVVLVLFYLMGQAKKGKNDAARDLNDTLNELLKTRDIKISDLADTIKKQGDRISDLEKQVKTLTTQNMDMEILIKTALKEHFAANPDMALALATKLQ